MGVGVDTVRAWRGRFAARGLEGLVDLPRSGRPSRFTPVQVAQVKALARQLPARVGVALSRWSCPELVREVVSRGVAEAVSASTARRRLSRKAIKPWQTTPTTSTPPRRQHRSGGRSPRYTSHGNCCAASLT